MKLLSVLLEAIVRIILKKGTTLSPDMLDISLWRSQLLISVLQIIITIILFYLSRKKLIRYINTVPPDDRRPMGELQQEYLGENIPSLSVSSVLQLIDLWAVIFAGAELVYCFTTIMYRKFTALLMLALYNGTETGGIVFVILYNMTHGFKYLEMMTSLLLGVVITGIFLQDRLLKVASLIILVVFMISFGLFEMRTVSIMGRDIGLVWTSIICHISETLGLFLLSYYLSKRYKGL